jgi:hypothetical protein
MTQEVTSVARIGVFGRRSEEQDRPTAVGSTSTTDRTETLDRDGNRVVDREERLVKPADLEAADTNKDGVVSDPEAQAAHERTQARLANRERLAAEDRTAARTAVVEPPPVVDRDRDGVDDRVQTRPAPPAAPAPQKIRARSSVMATFALIVGLTSVYCALTGRLAPVAVVLGVVGLLLSFFGLSASGRPRIAGSGVAVFALLLSVGGAVLGILAMNHSATWLDSDVDQVARLRDWLDTQFTFIKDW